jgi:hypothetical protein
LQLFKHTLTTTYFLYNGEFYEQTDGVAMGSPLSPVIANFYMEYFEQRALKSAVLQPKCWYRYVDDTFAIWPHGADKLDEFLNHLNNIHPSIKFTMETEEDGKLPFLDILIYKTSTGRLGHHVYRKPTHTGLYLNARSHHHPVQKKAVISSLVNRAFKISDSEHLKQELSHVKDTLLRNGYYSQEIEKTIKRTKLKQENFQGNKDNSEQERKTIAILPYVSSISNRIGRVLKRFGINPTYKPLTKTRSHLRPIKDKLEYTKVPGVYMINCGCGKVYIGQTGRTVETRIKEHKMHCDKGNTEKSAVAEHWYSCGDHIYFEDTKVLHKGRDYLDRIIKESIEITMHEKNFNKDDSFKLNKIWTTMTNFKFDS